MSEQFIGVWRIMEVEGMDLDELDELEEAPETSDVQGRPAQRRLHDDGIRCVCAEIDLQKNRSGVCRDHVKGS